MDNEQAYLDQCMPERVVVLGQVLNPFSLGHLKILTHAGNVFAVGGIPTIKDLVFAVWVCCQTYEEAIAGMHDPKMERKMIKWGRKMKRANLDEAVRLLSKYIKDAQASPSTAGNKDARPPGAP